jgi:hypothetical protein
MCKTPVVFWIANAAAHLSSRHGAVTFQAQQQGCIHQTVSGTGSTRPSSFPDRRISPTGVAT